MTTTTIKKVWDYLKRANSYWKDKTQPIKGRSFKDSFNSAQDHLGLDSEGRDKLNDIVTQNDGKAFISEKIDEINDYASHRAAFIINSVAQLLLVNLSAVSLLSLIPVSWFKTLLVTANLLMALTALWRLRTKKKRLLLGPSEEPEWTFWGMFRGNRRRHNLHVKQKAQPYKIRMRDERLFSIMYALNTITFLFAGQILFTDLLPSLLQFIINIPLFVLTIPLAIANGYWAFNANNQVVKAATKRGSEFDKLKI